MSGSQTTNRETALDARRGYDRVGRDIRSWRWSKFWKLNEAPIVNAWLQSLPPGRGVDAGSGMAPYLSAIRAAGHSATCLDVSWSMLHGIRSAPPLLRVQGSAAAMPLRDRAADWILCTRVLSHIADVEAAIEECRRVVKRGGAALITDVHPAHPYTDVTIPRGSGERIRIETYKHDLVALDALFRRLFRDVAVRTYTVKDLSVRLHFAAFEKLYRSAATPVFYVARLTA